MLFLPILLIICPLLVSSISFDYAAGTVRLSISQGELLGKRIDSYDNRTGYGFLGVPFAAPPVGPLRFAKPVPAPAWEGVRNVTVKGVACPSIPEMTYKRPEGGPMDEDCLHAYVYSSKNCLIKGGCPIMWVLHGGKYMIESPVLFLDEAIVHNFASDGEDVVVIIPAYRLYNFGFLNIAPGMKTSATPNAAVWDLLLALQWTHREAVHFGGDANRIILHGHSAGAQFSDVMSTSPHFEGLFHGMAIMSGADTFYEAGEKSNSLSSWVSATILGCATDATNRTDIVAVEEAIECMRGKSWQEIVDANRKMANHAEDYHGPHADGPGGILPTIPSHMGRTRTPFPTMIGTAAAEFHDTKFLLNADGSANATKVGELCEAFGYVRGYANPDAISKRCLDYYMQGRNLMSMQQDTQFFVPTFITARDMAQRGNKVYVYSFAYKGIGAAFKTYMPLEEEDHPSHSEDYVYIIGMHRGNFTKKDYEIEKIYSGMILNFVKTGYPYPGEGQPEWKPFSDTDRQYYEIEFDEYGNRSPIRIGNTMKSVGIQPSTKYFDDTLRMPGSKEGYEAGAIRLWVDDAERYGGPVAPPQEFPAHVDRFFSMDMISVFEAHHGITKVSYKTMESMDANYYDWINFIRDKRYRHLQTIKMRSIAVEPVEVVDLAVTGNGMMNILIVCVSAVLIFLMLRCFMHGLTRKERKDYEEL